MDKLDDPVGIPEDNNPKYHYCPESLMREKYGVPGPLTPKCRNPENPYKERWIVTEDVGPFRVTGHRMAVTSLRQIFSEVRDAHRQAYDEVKTAGMLCVRGIKHAPQVYSNHSWGTAIDLYFGKSVLAMGIAKTQRGFLFLHKVFEKHGWYWGAGFRPPNTDSMHFEVSRETIQAWPASPLETPSAGSELVAAADYIGAMGYDQVQQV